MSGTVSVRLEWLALLTVLSTCQLHNENSDNQLRQATKHWWYAPAEPATNGSAAELTPVKFVGMDNISGKTIVITGAARGIGHATAKALLARGAARRELARQPRQNGGLRRSV